MGSDKIEKFSNEVCSKLEYYVYRLIDPRNGETFYVGKGQNNRVFQHMQNAPAADDSDELSDKLQTIQEIRKAGLDVIHVIHRHGMKKEVALEVEAALIDAYPGLTNIMGGAGSNDFGSANAIEINKRYAAEEAVFKHKCLMLTLNRSIMDRGVYSATRFAWKMNIEKAEKVEFVLSVVQGMIIEVFKPTSWLEATAKNFPEFHMNLPDRLAFNGGVADEGIRKLYVGKRIPDSYLKQGAANPVRYSFK